MFPKDTDSFVISDSHEQTLFFMGSLIVYRLIKESFNKNRLHAIVNQDRDQIDSFILIHSSISFIP